MSEGFWGFAGIVAALVLNEYFSRRRESRSEDRNKKVLVKIDEVHVATNGLTKVIADAKLAQGTAEGKAIGLEQGRNEPKQP